MDTNVDNYTVNELMAVLGLEDVNNYPDIQSKTNYYINKFDAEENEPMATFFTDVQKKLLGFVTSNTQSFKEQTKEWIQNEYLQQTDSTQRNKVTAREQKVDLYDDPNNHILMKQEELGISNNFNVPVVQDVLNPNLKNITERFINLDSQYRQTGTIATNYTLDLSDHLSNVISMRLYSFQIPVTWYILDYAYGNTTFWITEGDTNIAINIKPGNYTPADLVAALNKAIQDSHFTNTGITNWTPVSYNAINGKITINLYGSLYQGPNPNNPTGQPIQFIVTSTTLFTFFDYLGTLKSPVDPCANVSQSHFVNQTLGWVMGYRLPFTNVNPAGNLADAVLDLNGPRYLILVIDDLNRNHLNNGLVSITELSKTLKMPNYYSPDLPYRCVAKNPIASNLTPNTNDPNNPTLPPCNQVSGGEILMEKLNNNLLPYPQLEPSAPRTLTQPQIYTINEIIKNNDKTTNYRTKAPTTTDVFAIIPVKGGLKLGDLYVDFGGSLQSFKRSYFGPVTIDRMQITLYDDRGNVLNLNGADWSVTLMTENLYQY